MKWGDVAAKGWQGFKAFLRGELILAIKGDKLFLHIVYTFVLVLVAIWLSMRIDATLSQVEQNKVILNDLEIYHAEKTGELVKLGRFSTVQENLHRMGSDVDVPETPATVMKRK